jgi:hypothetical protein
MWCIIQQLRVLQNTLDLDFQRLTWVGFLDNMMTTIQTYSPENDVSLYTRGEEHEDRWWKVAYDPSKDW